MRRDEMTVEQCHKLALEIGDIIYYAADSVPDGSLDV